MQGSNGCGDNRVRGELPENPNCFCFALIDAGGVERVMRVLAVARSKNFVALKQVSSAIAESDDVDQRSESIKSKSSLIKSKSLLML